MDNQHDFLIVGAGVYGATMARLLTDAGKKVLVMDKRATIGGMLHSQWIDGVLVHTHGPHVLHCNNRKIWDFIQRFTKIIPYRQRARVILKGALYSFPVNLQTLNRVWGVKTPAEAEEALRRKRIPRPHGAKDLASWVKAQVGEELYELFYRDYTRKQWGREPHLLPEAIAARLPIRMDANDNYFDDEFEGMPAEGFTPMMERMLKGIEVRLNADFHDDRPFWLRQAKQVVYSGSLDALYDYELGRLEYRSLRLEVEHHDRTIQGCPTLHYPDPSVPWTRVTEFNYFPPSKPGSPTVVMKEFPVGYDGTNEPYYPINDSRNSKLAAAYSARARKDGIIVGGRLGSYRYYDIHHVIAQALASAKALVRGGAHA